MLGICCSTRLVPALQIGRTFTSAYAPSRFASSAPSPVRTLPGRSWLAALCGSLFTGVALFSALSPPLAFAEPEQKTEPADAMLDQAQTLRRKIIGRYENRIRNSSTPEKVFHYFASHKGADGKLYMTPDDFLRSLTPFHPDATPANISHDTRRKRQKKLKNIPEFFRVADVDRDGYISFSEYIFFSTLLAIPARQFEIAFKIFDEDGNGEVDQQEFMNMMPILRSKTAIGTQLRSHSAGAVPVGSPLLTMFFGEDGKKKLRAAEFIQFLRSLHHQVLKFQFDTLDLTQAGKISQHAFACAIIANARVSEVDALDKRAETLSRDPTITFEEFTRFHDFLGDIHAIEEATVLVINAGHNITKDKFLRVLRAAASPSSPVLSSQQIDVLFHLFDDNGDGHLSKDEFLHTLGRVASLNKPRDLGFMRFIECVRTCSSG